MTFEDHHATTAKAPDDAECPNGNRPPECTKIDLCELCNPHNDALAETIMAAIGRRERTPDADDHLVMFRVTAHGTAGTVFTYQVSAPRNALAMHIAMEAYGRHGQALRDGQQTEPLSPNHTVEAQTPTTSRPAHPVENHALS